MLYRARLTYNVNIFPTFNSLLNLSVNLYVCTFSFVCVCVPDFKVGRFLHRSEYAVQADGSLMPLRWMAPESISDNKFTLQSSVW